jgi:hypothetical protein
MCLPNGGRLTRVSGEIGMQSKHVPAWFIRVLEIPAVARIEVRFHRQLLGQQQIAAPRGSHPARDPRRQEGPLFPGASGIIARAGS